MSTLCSNAFPSIGRRTGLAVILLAWPLMASTQPMSPASSGTAATVAVGVVGQDHPTQHHAVVPASVGKTPSARRASGHVHITTAPGDGSVDKPVDHAAQGASTGHVHTSKEDHASHDMSSHPHAMSQAHDEAAAPVQDHTGHDVPHGDDHLAPAPQQGLAPADHDMSGMTMGSMQGGTAPADARDGDYSDGIAASPAHDMHLHGSAPAGQLVINQLEAFHGRNADGQSWDMQAWYGSDSDKLWLRSEGGRRAGKLQDGNIEVLWNHSISAFWDSQLGVRHDFGEGPTRDWVAFGVQGLAPYWMHLEATGYLGTSGRTAARVRAGYEWLFTQRLILESEAEITLYGQNDRQRRLGSGVSDIQFSLRLRYEVRRQFAPYIGVNWVRRIGTSADYARQDSQPVLDRQVVVGVRAWF